VLNLPVAQILGLSGGKWRRTQGVSEFFFFSLDFTAGEVQAFGKISDLMASAIEEAAYALRYNVFAQNNNIREGDRFYEV